MGRDMAALGKPHGHLDGLLNRLAALPPKPAVGSGLAPRRRISGDFPGDAAAAAAAVPEQTQGDSNPVKKPVMNLRL